MNAKRTSTTITTSSAVVLAVGGIALLFGSNELLAPMVPGASAGITVLGQMVAAGWLAVVWLNWNQRQMVIGGIYGRPTVLANFTLYLISVSALAHRLMAGGAPVVLLVLALLFGLLTLVYAMLLLRGPFGSDRLERS